MNFSSNEVGYDSSGLSASNDDYSKQSTLNLYRMLNMYRHLNSFNRKISSADEMERILYNISDITSRFIENYNDEFRVIAFKRKYGKYFDKEYIDLILLIKEFSDFNIFEYISVSLPSKCTIKEHKRIFQARNNIILSILVKAKEAQLLEKNTPTSSFCSQYSKPYNRQNKVNSKVLLSKKKIKTICCGSLRRECQLDDLTFLLPIADEFKSLIIESDATKLHHQLSLNPLCTTSNEIKEKINSIKIFNGYHYEVEVFFLSLLGYKDKARAIKQKYNKYFNSLVNSLNLLSKYTFDDLIDDTVNKDAFEEYTESEKIVLRKIISIAAKRQFFIGIEFLLKIEQFIILLSEGRIWKNIGTFMQFERTYVVWCLYEYNIKLVKRAKLINTIKREHAHKLKELKKKLNALQIEDNEEENAKKEKLIYLINEMEKEKELKFVTSLKELIEIFFIYDLKELVMFFLDRIKIERKEKKVPIEIYEICLDYDEDISIDLMGRALSAENAKKEYMQLALLKKFFRLATKLLKFDQCKKFINSSERESYNYLRLMYKQQILLRNKEIKKTLFNKQYRNEGDKLITLLKEDSKIEEDINTSQPSFLIENVNVQNELSNSIQNLIPKKNNNSFLLLNHNIKNNNNKNNYAKENFTEITAKIIDNMLNKKNNFDINKYNNNYNDLLFKPLKTQQKIISNKKINQNIFKNFIINREYSTHSSSNNMNNHNDLQDKIGYIQERPHSKKASDKMNDIKRENDGNKPHSTQLNSQNKKNTIDQINLTEVRLNPPKMDVQELLIDQLRFGKYAFDALCLLSSIEASRINFDYAEKICQNFLVFTTSEDALTKCPYPLILISLAAEFLNKIGRLSKKSQYKTSSVATELLKLGKSIQSSIKDENMLKYFLNEQTDHLGRSALEICALNNFTELLADAEIGELVEKMWRGTGYEQSSFRFFRLTRILLASIFYENYNTLIQRDYLPLDTIYSFQFCNYTNNCSIRYKAFAFSVILSTILYQLIVYFNMRNTKKEVGEHQKNALRVTSIFINVICDLSLINSFLKIIYYYKTGKRIHFSIKDILINLSFLLSLQVDMRDLLKENYDSIELEAKAYFVKGINYSLIISSAWLRVVSILLKTYLFGSFFRIMYQLIWHVTTFLLIHLCFTFVFSQSFTIFFKKTNEDFRDLFVGFVTLFNTAFGQVKFKFTSLTVFGSTFLMMYTTVSNIILFNLIVGIINNLFTQLEVKALAENRSQLILSHERIKWDDRYGLLLLLPAPLNIISLFFIVVLLICDSKMEESEIKKLNHLFSKICYFSIALIYFFFFFIIGIIVYPFAYFKSIIHSIYDNSFHLDETSYWKNFIIFFTRFHQLGKIYLEDLYLFWTFVYKEDKWNQKEDGKIKFSKEYILALRKVFSDFKFKDKKILVPLEDVYIKLGLLNSMKDKNDDESPKNLPKKFRSFTSIKIKQTAIESSNSSSTMSNAEQMKIKSIMKCLLDKIVDIDRFVDVERALLILPYRVKYSESFLNYLSNVNIRVLLRGMRKYFFNNSASNQFVLYKKLQYLIYKLLIKFRLINDQMSEEVYEEIKKNFFKVNNDPKYEKTVQLFNSYEKKDDASEYDDSGDGGL